MTKCMYEGCTEPGTQMEQGPFSDMWVCAGCAEKIRRHREAWIRAREGMTLGERERASFGPGREARAGQFCQRWDVRSLALDERRGR